MSDVTRLLERAELGDSSAAAALFPLVYDELRRLAASYLGREGGGQTLQPTALVHEAWMRLGNSGEHSWQGREHFVAAAAEAMRRILVDRARRKLAAKRGRRADHLDIGETAVATPEAGEQVLEVNGALERLGVEEPHLAEVVKLRFFVGLNHGEIAGLLNVNEKTVRRRWELARVRLMEIIQPGV